MTTNASSNGFSSVPMPVYSTQARYPPSQGNNYDSFPEPQLSLGHSEAKSPLLTPSASRYPRIPMHPPTQAALVEDPSESHEDPTESHEYVYPDFGLQLPNPLLNCDDFHAEGGNDMAGRDGPYYSFAMINNTAYAHNMAMFENPSYRGKPDV